MGILGHLEREAFADIAGQAHIEPCVAQDMIG